MFLFFECFTLLGAAIHVSVEFQDLTEIVSSLGLLFRLLGLCAGSVFLLGII